MWEKIISYFAKRHLLTNLLLLLGMTGLCFSAAEAWVRLNYKKDLKLWRDEWNLNYRYDKLLGWFPMSNSKTTNLASRVIELKHNSRGFRDDKPRFSAKPRIMFLGDSFVWGFDVNASERFTNRLQVALPDWSIYNLGVCGYGTDQEYLLLQQQYDFYKPDIVFLLFCVDNDESDNISNVVHGGYYKPFFVNTGNGLKLMGVPVPTQERYFFVDHNILAQSFFVRMIMKRYFSFVNPPVFKLPNPTFDILRAMHDFCEKKGVPFLVGLQSGEPAMESFLSEQGIPFVDLSNPYKYPAFGQHWTPEGHRYVAEKIYNFLLTNGYLKMGTAQDEDAQQGSPNK